MRAIVQTKAQDTTRGGSRSACPVLTCGQRHHIRTRAISSSGSSFRSARKLGVSRSMCAAPRFYSLAYQPDRQICWRAMHLKSLRYVRSSSARRKARKAFHDHGEVIQGLGQIIRGDND